MVGKLSQRLLFSRMERYLIRNQAKQFVLHSKSSMKEQGSNSDSSDFYPTQIENTGNSPYYAHLFAGAVPRDSSSSDDDPFKQPKQRPRKNENAIVNISKSDSEGEDDEVPRKRKKEGTGSGQVSRSNSLRRSNSARKNKLGGNRK